MKQSQGRRIIEALKRKPMTSMQILQLGISTCWWKRVAEVLGPYEELAKFPTLDSNGHWINIYGIRRRAP